MTGYRYPHERLILALTLLAALLVIALTAAATVCSSGLFVLAFVIISAVLGRSHHQAMLQSAHKVTPQTMPELAQLAGQLVARLQPGPVEIFVAPGREMNAYTFGMGSPKVVVLYAALFDVLDADEISFVLGHELGHVALGHTWLNSLVGGLAGIPSSWSAGSLLAMVFLWWNRACEYSADRAGLLACGRLDKAVSALVKVAAGPQARGGVDLERVYRSLDAEDDTPWGLLNEALATHPLVIRRIEKLRRYVASAEYQKIARQMGMPG